MKIHIYAQHAMAEFMNEYEKKISEEVNVEKLSEDSKKIVSEFRGELFRRILEFQQEVNPNALERYCFAISRLDLLSVNGELSDLGRASIERYLQEMDFMLNKDSRYKKEREVLN